MIRRLTLAALVVAALMDASPAQAQPQVTLTLNSSNSRLEVTGSIAPYQRDKEYRVEISNVTEDKPWKLFLGGRDMTKVAPADGRPLAFTLPANTNVEVADDRVDLAFDKNGDPATVKMDDLEIPASGGAGGVGRGGDGGQVNQRERRREVRTSYDRNENTVRLVFDQNGLPIGAFPSDIDDNDVIQIVLVVPPGEIQNFTVEVEGDFADDEFSILSSGSLGGLREARGQLQGAGDNEPQPFDMGTFGPFAPPSITITINRRAAGVVTAVRSHTAKINKNYFAAFRFGVGQSSVRFNEYAVRTFSPEEGGGQRIKNTSDPDGEPRYFLTIAFYSWQFWEQRFWNGRDINEPPQFLDRISPYVGVGLKDFGDEFLAGVNFELARGLDVMWGTHIARTEELNGGFEEGDEFTADPETLPKHERWVTERDFVGVSVDLGVAVNVLQSVFGGGD